MIYARLVLVLGWMAAVGPLVQGADFSLRVVGVDSQRRPTLSLSGLTTGRYVLEASTNLSQWFSVTSGSAGAEPLNFVHSEAAQLGTVFYRGLQLPGVDVSTIVSQVDSNETAVGLITMASGGSLVLTNEAGVRYSFTVGPSNVIDTVAVRMQLVTNFTSFPYTNEMRTAVLFEPSGFEFHGAGVLEITFPTNVPHLKLSSFAFNADGRGFHLTPDVVSSNRVRIPVSHFSGVGTGLWAPSERTAAVTTFIESSRDRMSQEIAGILSQERERQLPGEDVDWSEIERRVQDYYDTKLKPFFGEAETDCALAQSLTREILAMGRQGELLGMEAGPGSAFLGSETSKKWNCNCLAEAIKACEEGKISDKTLMQTLLGAERQSQLLGNGSALEGCGLGSIGAFMDQALNKKLPCVPEWMGVVSYSDSGSSAADCSDGIEGVSCTKTLTTALSFQADVETAEMTDESFPPFFSRQIWTLKLFPRASGSFSSSISRVEKLDCASGSISTIGHSSGANSGPLDLEAELTFEDGELTGFHVRAQVSGDLAVPVSETRKTTLRPCAAGSPSTSFTETFNSPIYLQPYPILLEEATFTKRSPVALEGTLSGTWIVSSEISKRFSWTFSFRRNGP